MVCPPRGIGRGLVLVFLGVLAGAGCSGSEFSSPGSGGTPATGGAAGAAAGGSGGGVACAGGGRCVPRAPENWQGPIVLGESKSGAPECGGAYPNVVFTRYSGLEAADSVCDCACNSSNVTCGSMSLKAYTGMDCGGTECGKVQNGAGKCQALADFTTNCSTTAASYKVEDYPSGSCSPQSKIVTENASWGTVWSACAPASAPEACGESAGDCYPPITDALKFCIYADGDQPCPAGWISLTGSALYSGFDDTRGCQGDCDCGDAYCNVVDFFNNVSCATSLVQKAAGDCVKSTPGFKAAKVTAQTGCHITDNLTPTGAATPTGPITVCCLGS